MTENKIVTIEQRDKDKIFEYHPSDNVLLNVEHFDGPIATLYYMIVHDERYGVEYNIKTFPLHLVTDQFVAYLATLEKLDTDIASDFIKIATTLLKMKATALMHVEEEFEDVEEIDSEAEDELRKKLMIYEIVKNSVDELKTREKLYRLHRNPMYTDADAIIVIDKFNKADLISAFGQVLMRVEEKNESVRIKKVPLDQFTLETQVKKVTTMLQAKPKLGFYDFFDKNPTRGEIISTFEALLRLMYKQVITGEQKDHGEMTVELRPELVGKEIDFSTIISEE